MKKSTNKNSGFVRICERTGRILEVRNFYYGQSH